MKVKKFLVGAACFLGLTNFSISAGAVNSSNSKPKTHISGNVNLYEYEKKLKSSAIYNFAMLNNAFTDYCTFKPDESFKKFIGKNFINKKKELKDFNEKDLKEFLEILKVRLKKLKQDSEEFSKLKNTKKYKDLMKKEINKFIDKIKNNKEYLSKVKTTLKSVESEFKKGSEGEEFNLLKGIFNSFGFVIDKIESGVITEKYFNSMYESLIPQMGFIIKENIKFLEKAVNYIEKNINNKSEFKNKIRKKLKDLNIKTYYKLMELSN